MIIAKSEKRHNSINILQNSLKIQSGHLNIDPKLYAKYQHPSSSSSQDIMLTRFFNCYNARVEKRGIAQSIFHGISSKVNQVI